MWVIHTGNKSSYKTSFDLNGKIKEVECVNGDIETNDEEILAHYTGPLKCRVDFKEDKKTPEVPEDVQPGKPGKPGKKDKANADSEPGEGGGNE